MYHVILHSDHASMADAMDGDDEILINNNYIDLQMNERLKLANLHFFITLLLSYRTLLCMGGIVD